MPIFTQVESNSWICRIDALEVRLGAVSASITVFDDRPDVPPRYHCMMEFPAKAGDSIPVSRDFIAASLRNLLRRKLREGGDEPDDLQKWPQPAASRFINEPWQYDFAKDA